jgi:hypothetical protein
VPAGLFAFVAAAEFGAIAKLPIFVGGMSSRDFSLRRKQRPYRGIRF